MRTDSLAPDLIEISSSELPTLGVTPANEGPAEESGLFPPELTALEAALENTPPLVKQYIRKVSEKYRALEARTLAQQQTIQNAAEVADALHRLAPALLQMRDALLQQGVEARGFDAGLHDRRSPGPLGAPSEDSANRPACQRISTDDADAGLAGGSPVEDQSVHPMQETPGDESRVTQQQGAPIANMSDERSDPRPKTENQSHADATPRPDSLFEEYIVDHDAGVIRSARMRYYGPLYETLYGKVDRSITNGCKSREMNPLHDDATNERARQLVAQFNQTNPGRQRSWLLAGLGRRLDRT